jgi:protein TonB
MRSMLAESAAGTRRFQVAALLLAVAACAPLPPALEPPVAAKVPPPAVEAPAIANSGARNTAEYGHEVAELLHGANAKGLFTGRPPNPLRAVIVVYVEVDADGVLRRLELYRAPAHTPELVDEVELAWRRLGPQLPRPLPALMDGHPRISFTQTWLFDAEGRFRLRSLAEAQEVPPEDDEDL